MALTLEQLNSASREDAAQMLDGLYEHSPWIAEQALNERPFKSLTPPQACHVRGAGTRRTDAQLSPTAHRRG